MDKLTERWEEESKHEDEEIETMMLSRFQTDLLGNGVVVVTSHDGRAAGWGVGHVKTRF